MTDQMTSARERIEAWCSLSGYAVDRHDTNRLLVTIDATIDLVVDIEVGDGSEPTRVHDRFTLGPVEAAGLDDDVVETVVLGRSAMIDARLATADTVESVVAIYPDGLTRHAFMTAVFEVQKVRDLVLRHAAARAADAVTVAELDRLMDDVSAHRPPPVG